ncbi:copper amine oxidase [Heyndrickxia acidicola]|uniref:Copper amine oxidase n=1 Tax=Heyndrickxia acidicola TaxID=209389 RepID=A0ABU6MJD3_9BACI|nr:copper amine oxidase [Heyndrickxia acidicola]MED1204434.1 copper amine oxidase [Heyndrickxia acidicola]
MNINVKKTLVSVPLSLSLLIPAAGSISASASTMNGNMMMSPSASIASPAANLRADLDSLLSEHAYLAIITMQKGAKGAKDFQAAANALNQNTDNLSKAVASVYGEQAGMQFKQIWGSHIGYFVDYVKATVAKNDAAKQKAMKNLNSYTITQADFFSKATGGRLSAAQLEEGLKMHVQDLLDAFNNYVAGNYTAAYMNVREAISHMYTPGKGLSWAITQQFPSKFNHSTVDTPAVELREKLNYLLSEHAALAITAMQKGGDGAKDFQAAAAALNNNTMDLSNAIASVYGSAAGKQFQQIWSSHIGYFVDYVKATGNKDTKGKDMAISNLNSYRVKQAQFLSTATGGRLKVADLEAGLKTHVDELLYAFNSYEAGNYTATYSEVNTAYMHMFMVGQGLASAIVSQFPSKFESSMPSKMPKTGLTPPAEHNSTNTVAEWTVIGLALSSILAAMMIRRKKTN